MAWCNVGVAGCIDLHVPLLYPLETVNGQVTQCVWNLDVLFSDA